MQSVKSIIHEGQREVKLIIEHHCVGSMPRLLRGCGCDEGEPLMQSRNRDSELEISTMNYYCTTI